jgi:precorrin-2 dehydrogenase / sirohydrochlorin ferrochelatase
VKRRPPPAYYPLFLDLSDKLCIIVGGGAVAERKVRGLLAAGARVRLISPEVTRGIERLGRQGRIEIVTREYRAGDLEGAFLAFAATNKDEVNRRVREESRGLAIPLNVVDSPDTCDFIVPAVVRKGPVLVAISTSGLLPSLARRIKGEIGEVLSDDYAGYARRVGAFRRFLIEKVEDAGTRREIMERVGKADVSEVARMSLKEMKKRFLGP